MSVTGKTLSELRQIKRENLKFGVSEKDFDKTMYGSDLKLMEAWNELGLQLRNTLHTTRIGRWILHKFFPALG